MTNPFLLKGYALRRYFESSNWSLLILEKQASNHLQINVCFNHMLLSPNCWLSPINTLNFTILIYILKKSRIFARKIILVTNTENVHHQFLIAFVTIKKELIKYNNQN